VQWYRKAALQNNAMAQYNLGHMYELGNGVPMNLEEALRWYQLAARQGNENARMAARRLQKDAP